jgi:hypothetical protein
MKRLLVLTVVLTMLLVAVPVSANSGTLYVDDDSDCGGNSPCYATIQTAINAASDYDTILVYPGTYDPQIEVTPPCWGGHYYAQGIVVWRAGLTIQAVDGNPANTVIQSTFPGWMDWWRIQRLTGGEWIGCGPSQTGGYNPGTSAAPSAIMVVKDDVTIEGFTIISTYIGDPGQTWHPNSAGVMIGGVKAGDTVVDGVDGTTVHNCLISGWNAVYNWKSSNTTLDGNVMTNIQTTTAPMGSTVNGWGGWNEGDCSRSATGMRLLNNTITSVAVEHAISLGGYCSGWIDNSDLYIDGNTIVSPACGVALWQSGGNNKVMTCNNTVTAPGGGICVWSSTYDGPFDWDSDGDGIKDCDEPTFCWGTSADVPSKELGINRWIWDGSDWITLSPKGEGPNKDFTMEQTHGCSCFQILATYEDTMKGHYKFGCSQSVLEEFIASH